MKLWNKGLKHNYRVNTRPIIFLLMGLGFITVILLATMFATAQNTSSGINTGKTKQQSTKEEANQAVATNNPILAVVKGIDTGKNQITLFDVEREEEIVLSYNGGSNITDKYGKIISISQITLGSMVDVDYQKDKNKLTSLNISKRAWIYPGVNNMSINLSDKIMKIASTKYKFSDDITILDGTDFIPVENLAEQDELTVWGYEETIWSINVTKGHGLVKLKDYEDYIGNDITIGYESMQQITEDLEITVQEGTFNLTVENGRYSATKSVTIERNEVTYVTLSDLGPEGLKLGKITFEISPMGADLYIDRVNTNYSNPIELTYGQHVVIASLGGYTTYNGTIDVDSSSKTIRIDLPPVATKKDPVATETDTGSGSVTEVDNPNNSNIGGSNTNPTDTNGNNGGGTSTTPNSGNTVEIGHKIYVQNPADASVYLNGDFMGIAPCSFDKVIGTHVLTFIRDGYETMSYTVDIENDGLDAYFTFPALTQSKE